MKKDFKKEINKYDVVVIGAGSGGLNIAGFMNKAGFSVLLIDKNDENIGGDCLNTGCVPSKALIHIAKEIKNGKKTKKFYSDENYSEKKNEFDVDIKKVTDYIKSKQNIIREHENAEYFKSQGIDVVLGEAKFDGKNSVKVNDGVYYGKKIILATGSRPRKLHLSGLENTSVFTNENIFDIDFLPKHMVVIGGGPIGVEIGQAFASLGSKVSILARGFLGKEDKEISSILKEILQKEAIDIYTNTKTKKVDKTDNDKEDCIVFEDSDGVEQRIKTDAILVSIGRILNVDNLNLEKAGIELDNRGKIVVDKYLRTTNKDVITIGDIAGNFMFTHAAELHASVIINNLFSPIKKKFNGDKMSWVTYTDPEIATFGLSEKQLIERNIKYSVLEKSFTDDDRAIVTETDNGKMKLFVDDRGKVLGGTMIGENAGELIQELILLNSEEMPIDSLTRKIYPYPVATRINRSIALSFLSKKLTPFTKKIFSFMFKIKN